MRPATTLLSVLLCAVAATAFAQPPNVVIVMTDDQGYGELSAHGNPVLETPHLDRLRGESVRLDDFHVAPMCTPTRGQLLTGMDAARNGAINVSSGRALLRPEIPTMANIFAEAGYSTGVFGKWHLGDNYPFRPEDRGFHETVWFPSSHIGSVPDFWGNDYFDDTYIRNGRREAFEGYCTDVFFDEGIDHMRRSAESGTPFLTYIAPNTPHGPLIAKEEDEAALAAALARPEFDEMSSQLKSRLSSYLGMVRNIDTNMGKLALFLEEEGLRENTIVIFMTDNGSTHGPLYFNAGMRGMKTELWEGGHRVPFFISWPNGDLADPQDVTGLTQVQDVLPTLLDLTGLETAAAANMSGMSLAPVLRGDASVPEDRMLIINYSRMPSGFNYPSPYTQSILTRSHAGVLWKQWRLLEDRELYDLESDPLQTTNVIDRHPEVVARMRDHLHEWWDEVAATANEPQRIVIGDDIENPMMLTGCEWLDVFVDQQRQVRVGTRKTGYWLLDVAEAGEYEFALRRWPREIDVPLDSAPEGSRALPITSARLFISNHHHLDIGEKPPYGYEGLTTPVGEDDTEAVFTVSLPEGPIALHTWFDEGREVIASAYYVYVRRK